MFGTLDEEILQLCRTLAARFPEGADERDRAGLFPIANYQAMADAGLYGLMVPKAYGGLGADFRTYARAMEILGAGDGATALTFNMHNIVTGSMAELDDEIREIGGRRGKAMAAFRDWLYDEVVNKKRVFGSATSEAGVGSHFSKFKTTYKRVDGGYLVNGCKSMVSLAEFADYYIVAAKADQQKQQNSNSEIPALSYLIVEKDNPNIRFEHTWDSLGMRATSTHTMHLTDCFVPQDKLFLGVEGMIYYKLLREPHWLIGGYTYVYLGLSKAIFDFTTSYLNQRKIPEGSPLAGEPLAKDRLIQHEIGRLNIALEGARLIAYDAAERITVARGKAETNAAIHRAKYAVGELAPWLASQAIRICGGSSITRRLPLERYYRDARCGGLMVANSDECLTYVGKEALGIDVLKASESYW